jgi:hypothetical protein
MSSFIFPVQKSPILKDPLPTVDEIRTTAKSMDEEIRRIRQESNPEERISASEDGRRSRNQTEVGVSRT